MKIPRIFGDPIAASVAAGLMVGAIEMTAVVARGGGPELATIAASLLAALGASIGLALALCHALALRLRIRGVLRAALFAAPAAPLGHWLSLSLFQGAFAATLPGARSAHLWLPFALWASVAATLAVLGRAGPRSRLIVAVIIAAVAELANRGLFRSGYPDAHAFLIAVSVSALAAGLLGAGGLHVAPGRWTAAILGTVAVALAAICAFGLDSPRARAALTVSGNHTRHLVRVVRAIGDSDGDGYSPWLGGGDCNDDDAAVYPGRPDEPGNGVDDDCDGRDSQRPAVATGRRDRQSAYREFRAEPATSKLYRRTAGMDLVVISIDTLRAEQAFEHPNLRRLRQRSLWFSRALSPAAGTDLSMSSFVTGRIDPFVKIDTTILEALGDSGRIIHALLPREVLRYAGKTLLTRGVDEVEVIVNDKRERDVGDRTTSVETTDRALKALRELRAGDRPFVLWVHYFDVHEHKQVSESDPHLAEMARAIGAGPSTADRYRALVALTDRELGRLIDAILEEDDTIIAVLSDHGESLGDDPRLPDNHGLYVYQPLIHVPVMLAVPGVPGREIDDPVTLVDLSATLAALFTGEIPRGVDGADLGVYLPGDPGDDLSFERRPIILNESDQWGIVEWPYKLMVRPADNLVELYHLGDDPGEKHNLAGDPAQGPRIDRLKALHAGHSRPNLDRTRKARRERERLAQPPEHRRTR